MLQCNHKNVEGKAAGQTAKMLVPQALCTKRPRKMTICPPVPKGHESWDALMDEALCEARKAEVVGEVPVGAVIVAPDGSILARAHNEPILRNDPSAHAEVLAIRKACEMLGNYRLDDCVLVVTLEPCMMCAGAIVHARLAGVVFGALDDKAGAVASCLDCLEQPFLNHKAWYMSGIQENACTALLSSFFAAKR